jgi:hypothetical protein
LGSGGIVAGDRKPFVEKPRDIVDVHQFNNIEDSRMAPGAFKHQLQMMVFMSVLVADVMYSAFTTCPTGIPVYTLHVSQIAKPCKSTCDSFA